MKQDSIDKNMQERLGNLFKMFMHLIWHREKGKAPCEDRSSRWHADKEGAVKSGKVELFGGTFHILSLERYFLQIISVGPFFFLRQRKRVFGVFLWQNNVKPAARAK